MKPFAAKLIAGWVLVTLALYPIETCGSCKGVYQERMRQANSAMTTPEHRAVILAWAEKDSCTRCSRGRITLARALLQP